MPIIGLFSLVVLVVSSSLAAIATIAFYKAAIPVAGQVAAVTYFSSLEILATLLINSREILTSILVNPLLVFA